MSGNSALPEWQKKLTFLQGEEAKISDPGQKFQIQEQIVEAKAKIAELDSPTQRNSSPPPLDSIIPSNLPRLQRFFGRAAELGKILPRLLPDADGWGTLIVGPGGMGKTTLAIRAAELAAPGNFDTTIFLSAKRHVLDEDGVGDQSSFAVSGWMQMIDVIARRLNRPDISQASETERAARLCTVLTGARVLLVLDNLESLTEADQKSLFAFLKRLPRDCKALLTSRPLVAVSGRRLLLDKLDQVAALKLLEDIAQDNPRIAASSKADRIRLYTETAGNPLLLCWIAWQVGTGDRTTLGDALDHLRTCPVEEDPLEFIFGDTLSSLGDEQIRIAAALSYPSEPIPVEAIAEIGDVPEPDALRLLKILANRSLVVPNQEECAYALMPMVAKFLRKSRPEVVKEAGDRLEKCAYKLLVENGYKKHDRFHILDAAWSVVAAALPRFLTGPNDQLQAVCFAIRHFLEYSGRWDEQLALSQEAETKAIALKDFLNAGHRAYDVGWIRNLRGESDEVLSCAGRAEAHWRGAEVGIREKAMVISLRGNGYDLAKDFPAAIKAYCTAVKLWQTLGRQSIDVAIDLNALASAEHRSRDFTAAQRDFRKALRIAKAVRYHEGVAYITGNLAELALDREDWLRAKALATKALALSIQIRRQQLIASNCQRLAKALLRLGNSTVALPHARRAVEIYTRLGSPDLAAAQAILAECEQALAGAKG